MNFDETIQILQAAHSDRAQLSIASVDLLLAGHSDEEREKVRVALEVASVPHWFDEAILVALLEPPLADEVAFLARRLCELPVVEPFPARGPACWNVHKEARLALRRRLFLRTPDRFYAICAKAIAYARGLPEVEAHKPDVRIEALYHQLSAGSHDISEIERLCLAWSNEYQHQELVALGVMVGELINTEMLPSSLHTLVLGQQRRILQFYEELENIAQNAKKTLGVKPAAPVFVCYAHEDNDPERSGRWLDRLLQFLGPLKRDGLLAIFSDREIQTGSDWHVEITRSLGKAKAAILLISPAFMDSEYIANNELPILLRKAKEHGLRIFPVFIRTCLFAETKYKYPDPKLGPNEFTLASLQGGNPPSVPLIDMTVGDQDRVFQKLGRELLELVQQE